MRKLRHLRLLATEVVCLLVVLGLAPVGASSANISKSYNSNSSINTGSIVSLDPARSDYVRPSNTANAQKLVGIVVQSDDSLLAADVDESKIQVATSGTASVLVSTLNGDIKVGDQIAVSPFDGVGMKTLPGSHVIGLAQTAFNGDSDEATNQAVTDKSGKTKQIQVGYIRLNIGIGTASSKGADGNLNGLQNLVKSLTGHSVSTTRALISLLVAVVASIALITLMYASIYGGIISIGRNPLAKYAVFRTLSTVLVMAVMTALVAGGTIFLLLR